MRWARRDKDLHLRSPPARPEPGRRRTIVALFRSQPVGVCGGGGLTSSRHTDERSGLADPEADTPRAPPGRQDDAAEPARVAPGRPGLLSAAAARRPRPRWWPQSGPRHAARPPCPPPETGHDRAATYSPPGQALAPNITDVPAGSTLTSAPPSAAIAAAIPAIGCCTRSVRRRIASIKWPDTLDRDRRGLDDELSLVRWRTERFHRLGLQTPQRGVSCHRGSAVILPPRQPFRRLLSLLRRRVPACRSSALLTTAPCRILNGSAGAEESLRTCLHSGFAGRDISLRPRPARKGTR